MKRRGSKASLPSPEGIKAAFDDAKAAEYEGAVYVAISYLDHFTCDTARMIAESIQTSPIYVVDTKAVSVQTVLKLDKYISEDLLVEVDFNI